MKKESSLITADSSRVRQLNYEAAARCSTALGGHLLLRAACPSCALCAAPVVQPGETPLSLDGKGLILPRQREADLYREKSPPLVPDWSEGSYSDWPVKMLRGCSYVRAGSAVRHSAGQGRLPRCSCVRVCVQRWL